MSRLLIAACCVVLTGASPGPSSPSSVRPTPAYEQAPPADSGGASKAPTMDTIAEEYVKLVLALGQHDSDYVDAYYGPPEWKTEAAKAKIDLGGLAVRAAALEASLARQPVPSGEMERLRLQYLQRQVASLAARVR